nr:MFS transporter [Constantimarinum furrinae]
MSKPKWYTILLLILAGEAVFILPFVLARIFRPTFLDVFNLTNLELGVCFSTYGVVAFVSYLFGGMVADRFQPRILIALALVLTALGGFYLATYPSYFMMKVLWGYWGFTTIFLFWAALIKATRIWGGIQRQGLAFGFLDGGRGLVAAAFGSLGVLVFSVFIGSQLDVNSLAERKDAFKYVIMVSSGLVICIAILVMLFLRSKDEKNSLVEKSFTIHSLANFSSVIKIPSVWLLMIIILCAYVGYKTTDVFSLYAREVMGYTEIESAQVGNFLLYIRPVIGVLIGFLADKTKTSLMMVLGFLIMIVGSLFFTLGIIDPEMNILFLFSILITATGVYAFRTLYFAALQEGKIPVAVTGTAVGLISLIGYTPDIFAGPAMGYLLDNWPGELGHQYVFLMLAIFSFIGLLAAIRFMTLVKKP